MGSTAGQSLSSEPGPNLLPWPGIQWVEGEEQIWIIQDQSCFQSCLLPIHVCVCARVYLCVCVFTVMVIGIQRHSASDMGAGDLNSGLALCLCALGCPPC